jgi:hypothetical protein
MLAVHIAGWYICRDQDVSGVEHRAVLVTGPGATNTAVNQLNDFRKGDGRVIGFATLQGHPCHTCFRFERYERTGLPWNQEFHRRNIHPDSI